MSGMQPFIHEINSIYICLLYSVYSENIPFGQMIDSQRLLSIVACACKTLHNVLVKPSITAKMYLENNRKTGLLKIGIQPSNRYYKPSNRHVIQQALQ